MSLIIDQVKLKVNENEHEDLIKSIKEMKSFLKENDLMPKSFELFKDIDKEKDIFILQMTFENDAAFDVWEAKMKALPNYEELSKQNPLTKYFDSYLYVEKICLDCSK